MIMATVSQHPQQIIVSNAHYNAHSSTFSKMKEFPLCGYELYQISFKTVIHEANLCVAIVPNTLEV